VVDRAWWIVRSPWGRAFAALRDNPIRAESLGVNIMAYTLLAFAIGAAFAGVAGAYFATLVQFIEPGPFAVTTSLMMLLMVIVGGSGRFFGPMLGAAIVILLPEWLRFLKDWYLVAFGFAVVAQADKDSLLRKYWSVPTRQIETSVVLADARWMADQGK